MEFEVSGIEAARTEGILETESEGRVKSSLRMRYESEAQAIRHKIGDLETVRARLGLSQRKICQLLLVDPSAWTRWTKGEQDAPPHIYRALSWYLALNEKYPALDVNFWLNTVSRNGVEERVENRIRVESQGLHKNIQKALSKVQTDVTDFFDVRSQVQTKDLSKMLGIGIMILLATFVALEVFFRIFRHPG